MGKNPYLLKTGGRNCNGPGYITFHYNLNGHRDAPSLLGWIKTRGHHLYPKKCNCLISPLSCRWTWILSSCEKAWEGEQRSKVSIYCNKVEPQAKFISSRLSFRILKNKDSVKPSGITIQMNWFVLFCFSSPQVKAKRYWLASSTGILKNALHKSITIKNLFPVGMNVSNLWDLEKTEYLGIIMLFIVQSSWRDLYTLFSHQ